jgi:hypothetical protein
MMDAGRAVAKAETAARMAKLLTEHEGYAGTMARLEAHYIHQFRNSAPGDTEIRESAYFMLAALDALRHDVDTTIAGGAITARNLRNRA